eukprot:31294-Pelagococcus_subviridis.AAC.1
MNTLTRTSYESTSVLPAATNAQLTTAATPSRGAFPRFAPAPSSPVSPSSPSSISHEYRRLVPTSAFGTTTKGPPVRPGSGVRARFVVVVGGGGGGVGVGVFATSAEMIPAAIAAAAACVALRCIAASSAFATFPPPLSSAWWTSWRDFSLGGFPRPRTLLGRVGVVVGFGGVGVGVGVGFLPLPLNLSSPPATAISSASFKRSTRFLSLSSAAKNSVGNAARDDGGGGGGALGSRGAVAGSLGTTSIPPNVNAFVHPSYIALAPPTPPPPSYIRSRCSSSAILRPAASNALAMSIGGATRANAAARNSLALATPNAHATASAHDAASISDACAVAEGCGASPALASRAVCSRRCRTARRRDASSFARSAAASPPSPLLVVV